MYRVVVPNLSTYETDPLSSHSVAETFKPGQTKPNLTASSSRYQLRDANKMFSFFF